jgi:hypothetical protein
MTDANTNIPIVAQPVDDAKTCGCGPDCNCGDNCACARMEPARQPALAPPDAAPRSGTGRSRRFRLPLSKGCCRADANLSLI